MTNCNASHFSTAGSHTGVSTGLFECAALSNVLLKKMRRPEFESWWKNLAVHLASIFDSPADSGFSPTLHQRCIGAISVKHSLLIVPSQVLLNLYEAHPTQLHWSLATRTTVTSLSTIPHYSFYRKRSRIPRTDFALLRRPFEVFA